MYCKYCGKPLDDDSVYCKSCGRRLVEVPKPSQLSTVSNYILQPIRWIWNILTKRTKENGEVVKTNTVLGKCGGFRKMSHRQRQLWALGVLTFCVSFIILFGYAMMDPRYGNYYERPNFPHYSFWIFLVILDLLCVFRDNAEKLVSAY